MMLEKLNEFSDGKYEVQVASAQISDDYESKRSDAWERVEALGITKRIVSTCEKVSKNFHFLSVYLMQ